jgi:hypothetical protein
MKTHVEVTSSRRKARRAHFGAPSHIRHRIMSASLSKDLRKSMVLDLYQFVKMTKLWLYVVLIKDKKVKSFKFKEQNLPFISKNLQKIKQMVLHIKFQSILQMSQLLKLKEGKDRMARI